VPSRAAFSSGQFGITNGVIGHHGRSARLRFPDENVHPEDRPLLGGPLYRHGIYTASVSCFAERHLAYWFLGNFREAYKPTLSLGNDEDAADVNEIAISWLRRNAHKDNWFLHINYWDPHNYYFEPKEWLERAAEALGMRCDGVKSLSPTDQEFGGVCQGRLVDPPRKHPGELPATHFALDSLYAGDRPPSRFFFLDDDVRSCLGGYLRKVGDGQDLVAVAELPQLRAHRRCCLAAYTGVDLVEDVRRTGLRALLGEPYGQHYPGELPA
jgi:hypothetical protein